MSELRNESSASDSDPEFTMRRCGVCNERAIGKSMYPCPECNKPICQGCGDSSVHMGCTHFDGEPDEICSKCFMDKYKGKRKYCNRRDCDCDNPSPRRKKKMPSQLALPRDTVEFRKNFNVDFWKSTHPKINYPGRNTGKYLIDMFFSDDNFEHGYLYWLVNQATVRPAGQTDEAYENFQLYRQEAREILALFQAFTQGQKQQRTYNLRDRSPRRKAK